MKKVIYFIIFTIIIVGGIYYFIPKTIESCGFLPSGRSCATWRCDKGFAMDGIAKPVCLLGGDPVLQVPN